MIRLMTWNINGIRAAIKKGFWEKIIEINPDIVALQEIKADEGVIKSGVIKNADFGYNLESFSAQKKGYSGVAVLFKGQENQENLLFPENSYSFKNATNFLSANSIKKGFGESDFDFEGRFLAVDFETADGLKFLLVNAYYPQGGRGYHRIEYKISFYKKVLEFCLIQKDQGKNLILTGDFNTTFQDIDLARPKENRNNTGCLPEEREILNLLLEKLDLVDIFRHFNPDFKDVYTYWDQKTRARERNVGWRIDFFLVDKKLLPFVKKIQVLNQVYGSDHCPIILELGK